MPKLEGGFNHPVMLENGVVTKKFEDYEKFLRLREELSLRILARRKLLVPTVIENYEGDNQILLTRYINGSPLHNLVLENPEILSDTVMFEIGKILRELHSIESKRNIMDYWNKFQEDFETSFSSAQNILYNCGYNPSFIKKLIYRNLDICRVEEEGLKFVHRDFWLNNFLFDSEKNKLVGLLDFEYSGFGSPFEDFAIIYFSITSVFNKKGIESGYGRTIFEPTTISFILIKIIKFLSEISIEDLQIKLEQNDDFYIHLFKVLNSFYEAIEI